MGIFIFSILVLFVMFILRSWDGDVGWDMYSGYVYNSYDVFVCYC